MDRIRYESLLVLLVLMLLMTTSVFGETMDDYLPYAEALSELDVFLGTEGGYELERPPTRIEGLVMLIRLLGAEKEVASLSKFKIPFDDVPPWGKGYVVYAYKEGLTKGVSDRQFGSSNTLNARAFSTFALRSLGYNDEAGDFSYQNSIEFAYSIGLYDGEFRSILEEEPFLRGHLARIAYETLRFKPKGEDALLIDQLMSRGMVDESIGNAFIENIIKMVPVDTYMESDTKSSREIALRAESIVLLEVETSQGIYTGSGVVIEEEGIIVTNYHVIEGGYKITVNFDDGSLYTENVIVIDYDKELDLALLKIDRKGLPAVAIGSSDKLSLGDPVVAIGSPYGLLNSVSEGIISGLRDEYFQISAAISPGSSGGGLFNSSGELVGITTSGISEGENLGFAIKVEMIQVLNDDKMLPLSKFSEETTAFNQLPPPDNLRIADKTVGTACLQWDPVAQADYYYLYYQEQGEDTYWYDVEGDAQVRFYHQEDCSCYFNDLENSTTYNVYVTSVSEGIESVPGKVLTFTWNYQNEVTDYTIPFYRGHENVPDFGKIFGIQPYHFGEELYLYYILDFDKSDVTTYIEVLDLVNFKFDFSYYNDKGELSNVYISEDGSTSVIIGYTEFVGVPCMSLFIYE